MTFPADALNLLLNECAVSNREHVPPTALFAPNNDLVVPRVPGLRAAAEEDGDEPQQQQDSMYHSTDTLGLLPSWVHGKATVAPSAYSSSSSTSAHRAEKIWRMVRQGVRSSSVVNGGGKGRSAAPPRFAHNPWLMAPSTGGALPRGR